jgi:hypothetical protein
MIERTDYCNAIAALMLEGRKAHIANPNDVIKQRILSRQTEELQTQAAKAFAELNGWRFTERMFSIKTLIRGGTHPTRGEWPWELYPPQVLDHPVYFREIPQPYRPVAIVGQPYSISVEESTKLARSLGLDLYAPPDPTASWWYPGWTKFFCLVRPGVDVRFLPDQLTFEKQPRHDSGIDTNHPQQQSEGNPT